MYFCVLEAEPIAGTTAAQKYAAAAIACWINTDDRTFGKRRAIEMVEKVGWRAQSTTDEKLIDDDFYPSDSPSREYYEQALIDDEVFIIYTCPIGAD
jgi:hypothetical protein